MIPVLSIEQPSVQATAKREGCEEKEEKKERKSK